MVDTRTAAVLVGAGGVRRAGACRAVARGVGRGGGYGDELVPLATAPEALSGAPNWETAAPFAQAANAASALYATLRVQGSTATAVLVEVDANARRERGEVAVRLTASDPAALRAALATIADQANTRLQNDWKSRVAIGGGQRARVSASALYTSQAQWERIKQGLEGAARR